MSNRVYEPTWESLDSRPLPEWFDRDKIGVFVHWGPYSVPGWAPKIKDGEYGEAGHACWYQATLAGPNQVRTYSFNEKHRASFQAFHERMFGSNVSYEEIASRFKAELFDPQEWASLIQRSGAKWAILTSKFHDGFCLWPSKYSAHWNSVEVGARRDLLGEFMGAMKAAGLRSGFYYSLLEHTHPLYRVDNTVNEFVQNHLHPQFKEVVSRYSPSFIYLDGEWEFPDSVWRSRELLAWLYNESPCRDEVIVNDRLGQETRGKHGDVFCSEIGMERDRETKQGFSHKWIEDRPLADWSWNRALKIEDYLSERDMIHVLVETVANGGNLHIAVSPSSDGLIPYIQQERLLQLGDWLKVNGEAIHASQRHSVSSEGAAVPTRYPYLDKNLRWAVRTETPMVHYTAQGTTLYAVCMAWPKGELVLEQVRTVPETAIHLLGYEPALDWAADEGGKLHIQVPALTIDEVPCHAAYVFRITHVH